MPMEKEMAEEIRISVRELVEFILRGGEQAQSRSCFGEFCIVGSLINSGH